jgi:hypothetical protein
VNRLFNDAGSNSEYIVSNDGTTNEPEGTYKVPSWSERDAILALHLLTEAIHQLPRPPDSFYLVV